MAVSSNYNQAGFPAVNPGFLPDDSPQAQVGVFLGGYDPYWGGGEFVYARVTGAVPQYAVCALTPALVNGQWVLTAGIISNTANLGQTVGISMSLHAGAGYGWFCVAGLVPVASNASVAANTAFGIAAAGQAGAIAAGKQILGARVIVSSAATVVKANCNAGQGSTMLEVPNSDGWFRGIYLSGTGIAAGTTVTNIDPSGRFVTLSLATTAAVVGSVTGTYNNSTIFYNVAYINRPFAQGQIT